MVGTLQTSLDKTYIQFEMEVAEKNETFELPLSFFPVPTFKTHRMINNEYRKNSIGNVEFRGVKPRRLIEDAIYAMKEGTVIVQPNYYSEIGLTDNPEFFTFFCNNEVSVFTSFNIEKKDLPSGYKGLVPHESSICLVIALHEPNDYFLCAHESALKRKIPDSLFCREVYTELIRRPIKGPKKSKNIEKVKRMLTPDLRNKGRYILTFKGELIPLEDIVSESEIS